MSFLSKITDWSNEYDVEKDLVSCRDEMIFENGKAVNYDSFQRIIQEGANQYGIGDMVGFAKGTVKAGGIGNKVKQDALFVYNPQHEKDYVQFCIRMSHLGNFAFVKVDYSQASKLLYAKLKEQENKIRTKGGDAKDMIYGGVSSIYHFIRGDRANELKLEEEFHYINIMNWIFDKLVEVKFDGIKTGFFGTV